jgi:predicted TPR repeat methyltransferase
MATQTAGKTEKIFGKAMTAYNAGKQAETEKLLRKILRHNARHLDANFLLGNLYAINGQPKRALFYLQEAAAIKPDSVQVQNNLGNVYRNLKRYEEALACYWKVLAYSPHFLSALQNLGYTCQTLKRDEEAIDYFRQALEQDSGDAEILFALAQLLIKSGDHEEAATLLIRCQALSQHKQDEISLMLAQLGKVVLPERYPTRATLLTYKEKANSWDEDIQRSDHTYRGPLLVHQGLQRHCPESHNLSVLDLGCGTGACAPFLRPMASLLVGVDLSPDMLTVARQKHLYDELVEAELTAYLDRDATTFNLITAAGVFILIGSLKAPFQSVSKNLTPDGLFILTLYKGEKDKGVDGVSLRHNLHFAHDRNHIEQAAAQAGLEVVTIEEVIHETDNNQPQAGFLVVLKKRALFYLQEAAVIDHPV